MITYKQRAILREEENYTYNQSEQIAAQTGLIGYLAADFYTDGNGCFSSWTDWREKLKTDEFKAEFDDVINSLRREGNILHNLNAIADYCYNTPESKMQTEKEYYGVRVDTEKYAYVMRLNPNRKKYNLYCYCYIKDALDSHIEEARKGIRFINSKYEELFRIADGEKIKIRFPWGQEVVRICRYVDDYHLEIGDNWYHIYELAESMEQDGYTYTPLIVDKTDRHLRE